MLRDSLALAELGLFLAVVANPARVVILRGGIFFRCVLQGRQGKTIPP